VGVSKLNRVGGVMYEMDSEEAAERLKGSNVMKAFIVKMGSTADYQGTNIHMKWWWTGFQQH